MWSQLAPVTRSPSASGEGQKRQQVGTEATIVTSLSSDARCSDMGCVGPTLFNLCGRHPTPMLGLLQSEPRMGAELPQNLKIKRPFHDLAFQTGSGMPI